MQTHQEQFDALKVLMEAALKIPARASNEVLKLRWTQRELHKMGNLFEARNIGDECEHMELAEAKAALQKVRLQIYK